MAGVALLMIADSRLSGHAERLYQRAERVAAGQRLPQMQRQVQKGWVTVRAERIPGALCYTFTGGLWFSVLLPRSRHIPIEHPTVSSATGDCSRGDVNTLLFTFSVASKADTATPAR